jgi:hypothetical protein
MLQLLEIARRLWGPTPTREQIEITRHEFANCDYDDTESYDFRGGSYEEDH